MKILIVDNNDSFSYNLKHYVEQFADQVSLIRGSSIDLDSINVFDKIILSPGPGLPFEHPVLVKIIDRFIGQKPILGVCLGHQAIAEYFGAKLVNLRQVKHGVGSQIEQYKNCRIFKGLPDLLEVGHYHSWIVEKESLPRCLLISSENTDGIITSFRHNSFDAIGLQFHPESILTEHGLKIVENWVFS